MDKELTETQLDAIETIGDMGDQTLRHWADHFEILPGSPTSSLQVKWLLEDYIKENPDAAEEIVYD